MSQTTQKSAGRPGLQRKDVAGAIDALIEGGIRDPSLAQLRQHLGRGSNSTISRLRNEIRGERLLATRTPVKGSVESCVLPALVSAMERLSEEAAQAADDQVNAMRSEFDASQSTMMRERDKALAAAHDSRIELAARADQVNDLRDTIKALRAQISDEKRRLDQAYEAQTRIEKQATEADQAKVAAELSAAATIDALNARLVDQQAMIDSLIDKIGR